jgi:hypothetical protein
VGPWAGGAKRIGDLARSDSLTGPKLALPPAERGLSMKGLGKLVASVLCATAVGISPVASDAAYIKYSADIAGIADITTYDVVHNILSTHTYIVNGTESIVFVDTTTSDPIVNYKPYGWDYVSTSGNSLNFGKAALALGYGGSIDVTVNLLPGSLAGNYSDVIDADFLGGTFGYSAAPGPIYDGDRLEDFSGILRSFSVERSDSLFAGGIGSTLMLTFRPLPEPATWGLMLIGFGAIGSSMRRRRVTLAA